MFYVLILGARDFVDGHAHPDPSNYAVISSSSSQRCESSTVLMRTSLNGKRRNPKKILRRRSSSGAELLLADTMESSTSSSGSAWYRFKKELGKRADSDIHLNKRRGSLPVEALTAGLGKILYNQVKYIQINKEIYIFPAN